MSKFKQQKKIIFFKFKLFLCSTKIINLWVIYSIWRNLTSLKTMKILFLFKNDVKFRQGTFYIKIKIQ